MQSQVAEKRKSPKTTVVSGLFCRGSPDSNWRPCPTGRAPWEPLAPRIESALRAWDEVASYASENKNLCVEITQRKNGAASQIRTGDLILTKDALYRLSYSSIFISASASPGQLRYYIIESANCQAFFAKKAGFCLPEEAPAAAYDGRRFFLIFVRFTPAR